MGARGRGGGPGWKQPNFLWIPTWVPNRGRETSVLHEDISPTLPPLPVPSSIHPLSLAFRSKLFPADKNTAASSGRGTGSQQAPETQERATGSGRPAALMVFSSTRTRAF